MFREFTSTEDGPLFISRLEGVPTSILERISGSANVAASTTDSLLAIIRPDGSANVYWNEFQPVIHARSKKDIKAGELVFIDHIMDIERVQLPAEALATDVGICYLFSFGWRKGLFFDFGPAQSGTSRHPRDYDLEATLGYYFGRVLFQHLFSIEDTTWLELFRQSWFPFSHLSVATVQNMIRRAREQRSIDVEIDLIASEVESVVSGRLPEWHNDEAIAPHLPFIQAAHERFAAGDYISASSILYPRIEGFIRTGRAVREASTRLTQKTLSKLGAGTAGTLLRSESLLLPQRFEEYLRDVYFANFEPGSVSEVASRHSVSHGVVSAERMNQKATIVGFLILLQLFSVAKVSGVEFDRQAPLERPARRGLFRRLFRN